MDVAGQLRALQAVPGAAAGVGVVVAGDEVPLHRGELAHALDGLAQGALGGCFDVVHVAGHQHHGGALRQGKLAQAGDGVQALVLQHGQRGLVHEAEHLADLPIRCVQQAQDAGTPPMSTGFRTGAGTAAPAVGRSGE